MAETAVAAALIFADHVLSHLDGDWNIRRSVRPEIEKIRTWLETMKGYLKDMEGKESNEVLRIRKRRIRELAYDIEDILDEYMLYVPHRIHKHRLSNEVHGFFSSVRHWRPLREVISRIKEIKGKTDDIVAMDSVCPAVNVTPEDGASSSSHHLITPQIPEADEIVGFEKPREDLIRQLTGGGGGSSDLTISVVGPGGSGKTLLVKSVYRSEEVQAHFDSHAWVRVSGSLKINELINSMLKQIGEPEEELNLHDGVDILRNYLHHKRYVVVLDDIWRIDDWERIKSVLPNGSSGSRIIVTTCNSDVASFCVESQQHCIHLDYLPWHEAWGLFCKKAFQAHGEKCPPVLEEWSQKIVKRCEGLPKAIVAVGRWLSKKQQFPQELKKFHNSLGTNDKYLAIIRSISLPSYKDLPTHLKCCFLYFSIFPEDYSIERGRLIRLWVAEGFVMNVKGEKTPEDVAEEYLDELIERHLVVVSKWDLDGRARSCRVLNLVLDFIVSQSEDENFVSIPSDQLNNTPSTHKIRRLSIRIRNACAILSQRNSLSSVRSTFFFSWINFSNSHVGNVGDFKSLRVLDLQNAPLDEFPQGIDHLSLLRYLSLSHTKVKVVPESIKKLSNLETLDLKQTFVRELPAEIVRLFRLRHLLVYGRDNAISNTVQGAEMSAGIGGLTVLQKLSFVKPDKHRKIIKELGALTQLRKLGLIELGRKDGKDLCASIQKMQNLLTLDLSSTSINIINESLDLSSARIESLDLDHMTSPPPDLQRLYLTGLLEKFPRWISKLQNLFRIKLKWSGLQGSPLEALEDLPCLMELEFVDVSICFELVFQAGKFMKLKTLHIEQFKQLDTVIVQEGAMPELQRLTLCRCLNLKILPLGISNLTLKEFLLHDMPKDFIDLLQKTSEYREMVSHIPVIHSFTGGSLQNLS